MWFQANWYLNFQWYCFLETKIKKKDVSLPYRCMFWPEPSTFVDLIEIITHLYQSIYTWLSVPLRSTWTAHNIRTWIDWSTIKAKKTRENENRTHIETSICMYVRNEISHWNRVVVVVVGGIVFMWAAEKFKHPWARKYVLGEYRFHFLFYIYTFASSWLYFVDVRK